MHSDYQACKSKFKLIELISCFSFVCTSHTALEADSRVSSGTSTGSELSQPKSEFTGLLLAYAGTVADEKAGAVAVLQELVVLLAGVRDGLELQR